MTGWGYTLAIKTMKNLCLWCSLAEVRRDRNFLVYLSWEYQQHDIVCGLQACTRMHRFAWASVYTGKLEKTAQILVS